MYTKSQPKKYEGLRFELLKSPADPDLTKTYNTITKRKDSNAPSREGKKKDESST